MNDKGAHAEQAAATFLEQRGLKLLTSNYHCRYGEIDLVLQDGDTLVFAEVRLRNRDDFGGAAASITPAKQKKIRLAAQHYLSGLRTSPPCRFDAVLIRNNDFEWIKNAFGE
ncbi:MAG: YraN family protein [Pseudomonadota bacterium]